MRVMPELYNFSNQQVNNFKFLTCDNPGYKLVFMTCSSPPGCFGANGVKLKRIIALIFARICREIMILVHIFNMLEKKRRR